jgi:hypothetical protein
MTASNALGRGAYLTIPLSAAFVHLGHPVAVVRSAQRFATGLKLNYIGVSRLRRRRAKLPKGPRPPDERRHLRRGVRQRLKL